MSPSKSIVGFSNDAVIQCHQGHRVNSRQPKKQRICVIKTNPFDYVSPTCCRVDNPTVFKFIESEQWFAFQQLARTEKIQMQISWNRSRNRKISCTTSDRYGCFTGKYRRCIITTSYICYDCTSRHETHDQT